MSLLIHVFFCCIWFSSLLWFFIIFGTFYKSKSENSKHCAKLIKLTISQLLSSFIAKSMNRKYEVSSIWCVFYQFMVSVEGRNERQPEQIVSSKIWIGTHSYFAGSGMDVNCNVKLMIMSGHVISCPSGGIDFCSSLTWF